MDIGEYEEIAVADDVVCGRRNEVPAFRIQQGKYVRQLCRGKTVGRKEFITDGL